MTLKTGLNRRAQLTGQRRKSCKFHKKVCEMYIISAELDAGKTFIVFSE